MWSALAPVKAAASGKPATDRPGRQVEEFLSDSHTLSTLPGRVKRTRPGRFLPGSFLLWLGAIVLLVGGCVTESTGGLPPPAEKQQRVQAQLDLARGYLEKRDWGRAQAPLERALEIDPRSVQAHVLSAVFYENQNEPSVAEKHYRTALKIDNTDPQALNNYGTFLYGQKRYQEALEPLRLLVLNPQYRARSQAYENLGLAELQVGDRKRARVAFSRALMLNYAQPRSSLELAEMALVDKDFAKARSYYDGYRTIARPNARSLCVGLQLARAENNDDQIASFNLALKNLYPDSDEADRCRTSP